MMENIGNIIIVKVTCTKHGIEELRHMRVRLIRAVMQWYMACTYRYESVV